MTEVLEATSVIKPFKYIVHYKLSHKHITQGKNPPPLSLVRTHLVYIHTTLVQKGPIYNSFDYVQVFVALAMISFYEEDFLKNIMK